MNYYNITGLTKDITIAQYRAKLVRYSTKRLYKIVAQVNNVTVESIMLDFNHRFNIYDNDNNADLRPLMIIHIIRMVVELGFVEDCAKRTPEELDIFVSRNVANAIRFVTGDDTNKLYLDFTYGVSQGRNEAFTVDEFLDIITQFNNGASVRDIAKEYYGEPKSKKEYNSQYAYINNLLMGKSCKRFYQYLDMLPAKPFKANKNNDSDPVWFDISDATYTRPSLSHGMFTEWLPTTNYCEGFVITQDKVSGERLVIGELAA